MRECSIYRMHRSARGLDGIELIPMIVQTPDRGIVSDDRAPEPIARVWAKCNSHNLGGRIHVIHWLPEMRHGVTVAMYRDGMEIGIDRDGREVAI